MKKRFAAAAVAVVGAASAANAADWYSLSRADWYSLSRKDAPAYVPPPPDWTGFYIGAHVGGMWGNSNNRDLNDYLGNIAWGNNNNSGVFGGGTFGYNFQRGSFVIGAEADLGGAGLTGNWNDGVLATQRGYFWVKDNGSIYADVTGRLGYAVGPALFYVKGGWAYLNGSLQLGGYDIVNATPWSVSRNEVSGWTVGGGVEYLFARSWSFKAEYLYFDFGNNNSSWYGYGLNWDFERELTVNSFKVGVNYHFNGDWTPLK